MSIMKCDCGSSDTMCEAGYNLCMGCGVQLSVVLDCDREWRNDISNPFGSSRNRVGAQFNPTLTELSMRTFVCPRASSKGEARLAAFGIIRQHRWTSGSTPYHERTRQTIYRKIENVCTGLGINSEVQKRAKIIFVTANDLASTRSDGRLGVIAASILAAARQAHVPRSPMELATAFNISTASVKRGTKLLLTTMYSHTLLKEDASSNTGSIHINMATDFVPRFCSRLGVHAAQAKIANIIADNATRKGVVLNNTPPSIAGGAIWLAFELSDITVNKSRKGEIAKVAGVSVVTIAKVRKRMFMYRSHLISNAQLKDPCLT